jgi:methylated-DNA-[protein]-cysteine S-methyltransferase
MKVRYASIDSPIGRLLALCTPRGLAALTFDDEDDDAVLERTAVRLSPDIQEASLPRVRSEIERYFEGRLRRFSLHVDLALAGDGFNRRVLEAVAGIPYGSVSTYGDVAARAGSPRGGRAAGNAVHRNPVPIVVPCHRVVPADRSLGGYGGREDLKGFLLRLEGALGSGDPTRRLPSPQSREPRNGLPFLARPTTVQASPRTRRRGR